MNLNLEGRKLEKARKIPPKKKVVCVTFFEHVFDTYLILENLKARTKSERALTSGLHFQKARLALARTFLVQVWS